MARVRIGQLTVGRRGVPLQPFGPGFVHRKRRRRRRTPEDRAEREAARQREFVGKERALERGATVVTAGVRGDRKVTEAMIEAARGRAAERKETPGARDIRKIKEKTERSRLLREREMKQKARMARKRRPGRIPRVTIQPEPGGRVFKFKGKAVGERAPRTPAEAEERRAFLETSRAAVAKGEQRAAAITARRPGRARPVTQAEVDQFEIPAGTFIPSGPAGAAMLREFRVLSRAGHPAAEALRLSRKTRVAGGPGVAAKPSAPPEGVEGRDALTAALGEAAPPAPKEPSQPAQVALPTQPVQLVQPAVVAQPQVAPGPTVAPQVAAPGQPLPDAPLPLPDAPLPAPAVAPPAPTEPLIPAGIGPPPVVPFAAPPGADLETRRAFVMRRIGERELQLMDMPVAQVNEILQREFRDEISEFPELGARLAQTGAMPFVPGTPTAPAQAAIPPRFAFGRQVGFDPTQRPEQFGVQAPDAAGLGGVIVPEAAPTARVQAETALLRAEEEGRRLATLLARGAISEQASIAAQAAVQRPQFDTGLGMLGGGGPEVTTNVGVAASGFRADMIAAGNNPPDRRAVASAIMNSPAWGSLVEVISKNEIPEAVKIATQIMNEVRAFSGAPAGGGVTTPAGAAAQPIATPLEPPHVKRRREARRGALQKFLDPTIGGDVAPPGPGQGRPMPL